MPRLLSGRLCLDFVNTVDNRMDPASPDALSGPEALARWGHHVGLYDPARRDALLAWSATHPAQAAQIYQAALELREVVYRVFVAVARQQVPNPDDLGRLQQHHLEAMEHADLIRNEEHYQWTIAPDRLQVVPWQITQSAIGLLTGGPLERVKECLGCGDCGGLFVDGSKGQTRQWCSMEGCGSRAKMRRLYHKQRLAEEP